MFLLMDIDGLMDIFGGKEASLTICRIQHIMIVV